jgi:prepilin-type N-terminal cleavage/methylation domain-containing protein
MTGAREKREDSGIQELAFSSMRVNEQVRRPRDVEGGFSLIELIVVVGILLVATGFSVANLIPAIRNSRADAAMQTTLTQVRRARQSAIDERRVYVVTFVLPATVQTQRIELDGTVTQVSTVPVSSDLSFQVVSGIPTSPATPDGFGSGGVAIDLNSGNQIRFQPDGSAQDAGGVLLAGGVVYVARTGDLTSSRAVSVFGATGRIRGWKLEQESGGTLAWH